MRCLTDWLAEPPSRSEPSRRRQRTSRGLYMIFFLLRSSTSFPNAARPVVNELFRHAVMEVFNLLYYRALMGLNAETVGGCSAVGDVDQVLPIGFGR